MPHNLCVKIEWWNLRDKKLHLVVVVVSGGSVGGQMTITVTIWLDKSGIQMVDLCPVVI